MITHPLVRGDAKLVQDYMLTKATLFLAQNAPLSEWQFEAEFMSRQSGEHWPEPNVFLLGFTLARCICALEDARDGTPAGRGYANTDVVKTGRFEELFVEAVRDRDYPSARVIWDTAADTGLDSSVELGLDAVVILVSRLKQLTADVPVDAHSLVLAPPYGSQDSD